MGRIERSREIARRRKRRSTLQKLRKKYRQTSNEGERLKIAEKVRQISPFVDLQREETAEASA